MQGEALLVTYYEAHEAELTAAFLRAHGVAARVDNDVLGAMNPLWVSSLGPVRLFVPAAQLGEAKELLASTESGATEPEPAAARHDEGDRTARRALVSAVLGIFLLPGLAHLYSLFIAFPLQPADLSARGQRHRRWALVIDAVALALAMAALIARAAA